MKKVVLSLGGSILVKGEKDSEYIREIADLILGISRDYRFIIVTGGGRTAREYIRIGRDLGSDEATLDWIGISATRLNSYLLISSMKGSSYPKPFETVEEALLGSASFPVTIGGGTHPGHTTDTVAALIAERWKADLFLNLTTVDGVYTADPNVHDGAERFESMTTGELLDLVSTVSRSAGSHSPMDPLASRIIHRSRIPTTILNGRDLGSVKGAVTGTEFRGTIIEPVEDGES
jgi:uridylate kinase